MWDRATDSGENVFDNKENFIRLSTEWRSSVPPSMTRFISVQLRHQSVRACPAYIKSISTGNKRPSAKLAAGLEAATGIHKNLWTFGEPDLLRIEMVERYPPCMNWQFEPGPMHPSHVPEWIYDIEE